MEEKEQNLLMRRKMLKSHPGKRSADRVAFIILKQQLCRGRRGNMRPPVPTAAETIPLHKGGWREANVVYETTRFFLKSLDSGTACFPEKRQNTLQIPWCIWGVGVAYELQSPSLQSYKSNKQNRVEVSSIHSSLNYPGGNDLLLLFFLYRPEPGEGQRHTGSLEPRWAYSIKCKA